MTTDVDKVEAFAIVAGLGLAGYLAWKIIQSPAAAGGAVVKAAGQVVNGAVTTAVGGAGSIFGLPTPDQTETDPAVARYLIDSLGYFTASQWTSAGALLSGSFMLSGSGTPPAANAPVWAVLRASDAARPIDMGTGTSWDTAAQGLPDVGTLDPGTDYLNVPGLL